MNQRGFIILLPLVFVLASVFFAKEITQHTVGIPPQGSFKAGDVYVSNIKIEQEKEPLPVYTQNISLNVSSVKLVKVAPGTKTALSTIGGEITPRP